jgi:DNA-binding PadR family transcriptional regulator
MKGSGAVTRTLILGTLAAGQMHGYEIKKRILEALGECADINFGSIYYGLRSLTDNGLVDHIRDEPGQGSPERSIYRITPRGRKALAELVESCISEIDPPLLPLEAGLNYMDRLPRETLKKILSERYASLNASYEQQLAVEPEAGESEAARIIREYRLYQLGAEVHWLKNVLPTL